MRMHGDWLVPESDEDVEELVEELKKKATVFQMDTLSPKDQVRVRKAKPGLVARISKSHLIPPVLL
jgi:hypothetical protein